MKKFFIIISSFLLIFSMVLSVDSPKAKADTVGSYVVISNESVNSKTPQSTGTFNSNQVNSKMSLSSNLDNNLHKTDVVFRFEPKENESNIRKNLRTASVNYQVGDEKTFWVTDIQTDIDYTLNAKLVYSGQKVNVWGDKEDQNVTSDDLKKIGAEFENNIRPLVVNNFGPESDVDGDGKINILCFDIQDGFSGIGGYVAGYFYPRDLYYAEHSNYSETFYIDTYPLINRGTTKNLSAAYSTLAHEFQHMVNYNRNVLVEKGEQMDIWLDEALAMAAEQMYLKRALSDRISYYNGNSSIANGHSLLDWDYYGDTLANYSLSYLFGQYIKLQAGKGDAIFKEIITNPNNDYRAVEEVVKKYINSSITFGQMMTNFRIALLLNQPTGLYGFKGDSGFYNINKKIYSNGSTDLSGGGAIVKLNPSNSISIPADKGEDVTYTFIYNGDVLSSKGLKVNEITYNDTVVTGKSYPNVDIYVKRENELLGKGKATSSGDFSVAIEKQEVGANLTVYAEDESGKKSESILVEVKDKNPPTFDLSHSPTAWTNKSVTINLTNIKDEGSGYKKTKLPNGTEVTTSSPSYTVGSNGTYSFTVVDNSGNEAKKNITISNIDKTLPTFNLSYTPTTVTNGSVTIKVTNINDTGGSGYWKTKLPNGTEVATTSPSYTVGSNGTYSFTVIDKAGNQTTKNVTISNIDKTPPAKPTVNTVADNMTTVTGKTEAYANVFAFVGSTQIGKGTANSTGAYTIAIPKQKAGKVITVFSKDKAGNKSAEAKVTVIDKTPPATLTVNTVGDNATKVTGKTEASATVYVKVGSKQIGKGTATSTGAYTVKISAKQKAGTSLTIIAADKAGNKKTVKKAVVDKTPPAAPKVNKVTKKTTYVKGTAEKSATIYIYRGSKLIGKGTVSKKGTFSVKIAKQKRGTVLKVYVTDKAKNRSAARSVKVQ